MNYITQRNAYYTGLALLIVYGLQGVGFVGKYVKPILDYQLFEGLSVITIISAVLLVVVYLAWSERKIG